MLFNSTDAAVWDSALALYPEAFKALAATKTDQSIIALDKWYQTEFPAILALRSPCLINHDEIVKLVAWKLKVRYHDKTFNIGNYKERNACLFIFLDLWQSTPNSTLAFSTTSTLSSNKITNEQRATERDIHFFCSHSPSFYLSDLFFFSHSNMFYWSLLFCMLLVTQSSTKNKKK